MRYPSRAVRVVFLAGLVVITLPAQGPPQWAYGTQPAGAPQPPKSAPDNAPKRLPGASASFTEAQIQDRFAPADWFPGDHPAMPEIIAHGRKPDIWACSLCHYPNGKGRPENAAVSGLPVSYFIHQMEDFKNGLRKSADRRKQNTNLMIAYAKAMTDEEIKTAAEYFGAMGWTPWIKVVETASVPKTGISVGMFLPLPGDAKEPLGERIIEIPVNPERTEELRDPRSGFVAYAPIGSIKKGEALVKTGAGRTVACGICHGEDLKGMGPVPGIAGRSPSYLARQLYDMQQNTRHGEWTSLMKPVVERLQEEDILNIAAHTASRQP
jgi:cytochrome c553